MKSLIHLELELPTLILLRIPYDGVQGGGRVQVINDELTKLESSRIQLGRVLRLAKYLTDTS